MWTKNIYDYCPNCECDLGELEDYAEINGYFHCIPCIESDVELTQELYLTIK